MQIDQESLDVLKADDILSRVYQNQRTGQVATLFIAYFDTQRTGKAPHSRKIACRARALFRCNRESRMSPFQVSKRPLK